MTTLVDAVNKSTMTETENGDITHLSSANDFVDLFFKIGASRGRADTLSGLATKCAVQDLGLTMRLMFWARDVRGGAGERDMFRTLVKTLISRKGITQDVVKRIINKTVEVGRWDDVLHIFYGTKFVDIAFEAITNALRDGDGLCAKWMPREKSANRKMAHSLRKYMKISAKQYRQMIAELTAVVETQMCKQEWTSIEFDKVPSQAVNNYRKAFARNAPVEWEQFLSAIENGDVKINAGAIYPYQLIKRSGIWGSTYTMDASQVAQWEALPDYSDGVEASILPVVDVSGSMGCPAGTDTSVTCLDVAVSLGLYLSEKLNGKFKDSFVTFSDSPKLKTLKGTIHERLKQLSGDNDWQMSTNLDAVFELLLTAATKHKVAKADMPTTVLILSDMQFNRCVKMNGTAFERTKQRFIDAGYDVPQIVFWNLNARDNAPVTFDTSGAALVSGFSPSLVKSILSCKDMSPTSMMFETLMNNRYNW